LLAKIVIGVSPQQFLRTKPEQNWHPIVCCVLSTRIMLPIMYHGITTINCKPSRRVAHIKYLRWHWSPKDTFHNLQQLLVGNGTFVLPTLLSAAQLKPSREQSSGRYLVTGPLTTCILCT
jgi:hypothetical protein